MSFSSCDKMKASSFVTFLGWQVFSKWVIGWKAPPLEHTWQKSGFVEWSRWSNKIDHSCKFLSEWQICSDWDIWWQVYFLWYRGKWLSCINYILEYLDTFVVWNKLVYPVWALTALSVIGTNNTMFVCELAQMIFEFLSNSDLFKLWFFFF